MPKALDRSRPASSISNMLDAELVEQATKTADNLPATEQPTNTDSTENTNGEHTQHEAGRTGEPADIQKMYRLTPATYQTIRQLAAIFSKNLGFDLAHSAVVRSVLVALAPVIEDIHQLAQQQITARKQPSTALGNEHIRDALEAKLAEVIRTAISRSTSHSPTSTYSPSSASPPHTSTGGARSPRPTRG